MSKMHDIERSKDWYSTFRLDNNKKLVLLTALCISALTVVQMGPTLNTKITFAPAYKPHTIENSSKEVFRIYIRSQGRLGNKLFQLASAIGIATKNKRCLVIDSVFAKAIRNIFLPTTKRYFRVGEPPKNVFMEVEKYENGYEEDRYFTLPSKPVEIRGYFQSYKYFKDIEPDIRDILIIKSVYRDPARAFINELLQHKLGDKSTTFIAIHIRRQDFLSRLEYNGGARAPNATYIHKAMEYFRKRYHNVHFIMCSDDIVWCKHQFPTVSDLTINQQTREMDLAIMTECDHMIMTIGSFSWWAAWLNGGEVVYFDKPYVPPHKPLNDDYFLPHWIPMGN